MDILTADNLVLTIAVCTDAINSLEPESESLGVAYLKRGVANRNLGNFDQSVIDLEQSLKILKQNASVMRMLAWTYREMDRTDEAEDLYTDALRIDDHWQARISRCVVRTDLQRFSDALSDCRIAAEKYAIADDAEGPNIDIAFFTAHALNGLGRYDEAYEAAVSEIKHADVNGRLYFQALTALWNGDRREEVPALLREGLQRYPDDPDIEYFMKQAGLR